MSEIFDIFFQNGGQYGGRKMSFSWITAKSTTFLNNIKKQKNQSGYELSLCQNSRKSVEKQKSYGSLKLLFFPKKSEKTDKTQIISLDINNFK